MPLIQVMLSRDSDDLAVVPHGAAIGARPSAFSDRIAMTRGYLARWSRSVLNPSVFDQMAWPVFLARHVAVAVDSPPLRLTSDHRARPV